MVKTNKGCFYRKGSVVAVHGTVDATNFAEFCDIASDIEEEELTIDAKAMAHISTAGMGVLVSLTAEKNVIVTNANDHIKECLELLGIDELVKIQ